MSGCLVLFPPSGCSLTRLCGGSRGPEQVYRTCTLCAAPSCSVLGPGNSSSPCPHPHLFNTGELLGSAWVPASLLEPGRAVVGSAHLYTSPTSHCPSSPGVIQCLENHHFMYLVGTFSCHWQEGESVPVTPFWLEPPEFITQFCGVYESIKSH